MSSGISVYRGALWKPCLTFVNINGVWRSVVAAYVQIAGVWRSIIPPLTASASPSSASASGSSSNLVVRPTYTTGSVTVTPSGGSGSYAYAWTIAFNPSGSVDTSGTASVTSPTSATTTFSGQTCNAQLSPGSDAYTASCTVQDLSTGATVIVSVPVTITNTYVSKN